MRRAALDLLGHLNGTAIALAALLAVFLIGLAMPGHVARADEIRGTAIVEHCTPKHQGGRRSNCHGRFDPDGDAPIVENVTFTARRKYRKGEMLNARLTDPSAREARIPRDAEIFLDNVKPWLIGAPVLIAAGMLLLVARFRWVRWRERTAGR
jgi:hypothetical protein